MHKYNVVFTFEKQGEVAYCKGDGFEYAKVGELSMFKQTGKIPSLRVIKTIIKKLKEV